MNKARRAPEMAWSRKRRNQITRLACLSKERLERADFDFQPENSSFALREMRLLGLVRKMYNSAPVSIMDWLRFGCRRVSYRLVWIVPNIVIEFQLILSLTFAHKSRTFLSIYLSTLDRALTLSKRLCLLFFECDRNSMVRDNISWKKIVSIFMLALVLHS